MDIARSPILMGLSDVLDGTADWLSGQNGSLGGLIGGKATPKRDSLRALKLAECLKELASFQRAVSEEDDSLLSKDLNSTLFMAGSRKEKETASSSSEVKNSRRREVKDVQQKPWSFSTKSVAKGDAGMCKGDSKVIRVSKKSSIVAAKPRQYVIHSNPLANGRRLSGTSSKRRESIERSPSNCQRMSNSPSFKTKSVERRKNGASVQASECMKALERTPITEGDGKAAKLTDRQKVLLKRVMNSPMNSPPTGLKRIHRDKAGGVTSSVDLSASARRARRLSRVLRDEHEVKHLNEQYAKELQELRRLYAIKEDEADRAQSAGMLLRQVCANQAEELKAFKGAFPNIMKDMSDLRENYYKQQNELQLEVNAKLSLQEEASKLRDRVDCLTNDIKQTRTLNTVLAERVQQYEKSQCTGCRLHSNQKPLKKEVSPLSGKPKAGQSFKTPPRPRSDSNLGRRNSPRAAVSSMKEVENDIQQENKRPSLKGTGESVWNDCALQARCENVSQGHSNTDSPPIDALKNRMSSLLLTASQALENQHRTMSTVVYENEFRAR